MSQKRVGLPWEVRISLSWEAYKKTVGDISLGMASGSIKCQTQMTQIVSEALVTLSMCVSTVIHWCPISSLYVVIQMPSTDAFLISLNVGIITP